MTDMPEYTVKDNYQRRLFTIHAANRQMAQRYALSEIQVYLENGVWEVAE